MIDAVSRAPAGGRPPGASANGGGRHDAPPTTAATSVARHALFWLVAGTAVGLVLAALLAFPRLGTLLGPFGYGRLMALHLELPLYGWTAIPMLGLLFVFFELDRRPTFARRMLDLWSAALAAGAATWLAGRTSGKLFLDWTGGARVVFLGVLAVLWAALVVHATSRWAATPRPAVLRIVTLALLAGVPPILAGATERRFYPPIDPTSGSPTGVSLLASTLALVLILLGLPRLAGLARRPEARSVGMALTLALAAHAAVCAALFGPDRTNDDWIELAALASVLPWVVLVPLEFRAFLWPAATRRWAAAALAWGGVLAASGVVQFLPEPLAAARFTQLLVAHAHAAMAGFTSSASFVLLELALARDGSGEEPLGGRTLFALWQAGSVVLVGALVAAGLLEAADPAAMLRGSSAMSLALAARASGGAMLFAAAVYGFSAALRLGVASEPLAEGLA